MKIAKILFIQFLICLLILGESSFAYQKNLNKDIPAEAIPYFTEIEDLTSSQESIIKNFDIIIDKLNAIAKKFSENPSVLREVYNDLGKISIVNKKFDNARRYLTQSYNMDPKHPDVYFYFGLLEEELTNYENAQNYYKIALENTNSENLKARIENNLGSVYHSQQKYTDAIKHYTYSLFYMPSALSYVNRGNCFADMNDYSTAIMDYDQAILLDGNFIKAYYDRGIAHLKLKNYSVALKDFEQILELNPEIKKIYFQIGFCHSKLQNYNYAIEAYTEYIKFHSNDKTAYLNRGINFGQIGDYSNAIFDFTQAIRIDPKYGLAYKMRGVTYRNMGLEEQAHQDFQRAINLGI